MQGHEDVSQETTRDGLFECVIKCFASSESERRMRDDGRCGWNAININSGVWYTPRGRDPDFFRWPGKVNERVLLSFEDSRMFSRNTGLKAMCTAW